MSKKNLVFLGDSITAGVIAGAELDYRKKGYAKFIEEYFVRHDMLMSSYNFAVSGFMTGDVLKQVKNNISYNENIAFNILSEKCYKYTKHKRGRDTIEFKHPDIFIVDAIKNADMIVLTIGANDLIRLFRKFSEESVSKILHSIVNNEYTKETVHAALKNYLVLFNFILNINPNVEIILVGTYVPSGDERIVDRLYNKFCAVEDAVYDTVANEFPNNVKLVKPRELFKANSKEFVNNYLDIHPSTEGHKAIADMVLNTQETASYKQGEVLVYGQTQV